MALHDEGKLVSVELHGNQLLQRSHCVRCQQHAVLGWTSDGVFACAGCRDSDEVESDDMHSCDVSSSSCPRPSGDGPAAQLAFDRCDDTTSDELLELVAAAYAGSLLRHRFLGIELFSDPTGWTVSATVWSASRVLACYLLQGPGACAPGSRVCELGAGCGGPGLALQARIPACEVTLTDLPHALPMLQLNAGLNAGLKASAARVRELCWGSELHQHAALGPFDVIIGADLVYDDALHDDLLASLTALASAGKPMRGGASCRVVLALPERDDGDGLARFLERSTARRWSWRPAIVAHTVGGEPGSTYPIVVFEGRPPASCEVIL